MKNKTADTIVAPATAPGHGAIAIVRLSGARAHEVFLALFRLAHPRAGSLPMAQLMRGTVVNAAGEPLDDALGVIMRAPRTYTGEDTAEFHVHGSPAVVSELLDACLISGARLAYPGEFTRRAVLNGRLDLAKAEAVADLIAAQTAASRRAALRQLGGQLSASIEMLRSELLNVAAHIEACLDFPEEDVPPAEMALWQEVITRACGACECLLASHKRGRMARTGARVVIAGAPNAGKSSLFNALVGRERAIVTPHPGTTRDTIESTVDMAGIAVTLVDTAGLHPTTDAIEQMGILRTASELNTADLILHVVDASAAAPEPVLPDAVPVIRIMNKCDLLSEPPGPPAGDTGPVVFVSTLTRAGIETLERMIADHLACEPAAGEVLITSARHAACLAGALTNLKQAAHALAAGLSGDLVMVDVRGALQCLGEIIGTDANEEILDRIFANFCLGK